MIGEELGCDAGRGEIAGIAPSAPVLVQFEHKMITSKSR